LIIDAGVSHASPGSQEVFIAALTYSVTMNISWLSGGFYGCSYLLHDYGLVWSVSGLFGQKHEEDPESQMEEN